MALRSKTCAEHITLEDTPATDMPDTAMLQNGVARNEFAGRYNSGETFQEVAPAARLQPAPNSYLFCSLLDLAVVTAQLQRNC